MAKETDFATLSSQIAAAMVSALDARPRSRSGDENPVTVTIGAVMTTGNGIPTVVDPFGTGTPVGDLAPPNLRSRPLSRGQISGLTGRAPLTRTSIGRLNDDIGTDPATCLSLLKALAADPNTWNDLFELDDYLQELIVKLDPKVTKAFVSLVSKLDVFADQLTSVTFDITPPPPGKPRGKDDPWYVPDKLELEIKGAVKDETKGGTTEGSAGAKLVWEF